MSESVHNSAGKYVVVVDVLGYTDAEGIVQYAPRGSKVELSAEEAKRLSGLDVEHGVFPGIAKPDSKAAKLLSQPIAATVDPAEGQKLMHEAHEVGRVLLDPGGGSVDEPSEDKASFSGESDYGSKSVKELKQLAGERGIEGYSELKKDELVEKLNESEGVTPRVGAASA
jgi:hypothetical protein